MMRNSRMVTFRSDGLILRLYGAEISYWSEDLWRYHLDDKVYFRYNPDDLSEIRVYDEQDRFIGTAQQRPALSYYASKDEVAERMRERRKLEKTIAAYKKDNDLHGEDALALKLMEAERKQELPEVLDPKIITPIRKIDETEQDRELAMAMAAGMEPLDWTDAIERLKKEKED